MSLERGQFYTAVKTPKSGADKRDAETIKKNGSSHIIDSSCPVMIDLL